MKRRRRKRRKKKTTQILERHARTRAAQRYKLNINIPAAVAAIKNGKAIFVERQSHRVTVWEITQDGTSMRVVYDSTRGTLITCLPPSQ